MFLPLLLIAAWLALLGFVVFAVRSPYKIISAQPDKVVVRHKTHGDITINIQVAAKGTTGMTEKAYRIMGRRGISEHLVLTHGNVTPLVDKACTVRIPHGDDFATAYMQSAWQTHTLRLNFRHGKQLLVAYVSLPN
jgi:hypothetical protein